MTQSLWHSKDVDELIGELATNPRRGLTEDEVKRRLERYGYNELKEKEKVSPLALFFNQFKNVLIIILLVAIVLSALVGELVGAGIIMLIVIFCAALGFIQEYRAERALEALKKMLTPTVGAIRGRKEQEVPSKHIVRGDILLLEAGGKIPADARLIEIRSLKCDEAPLTGESFAVDKDFKVLLGEAPIGDRKNMVLTGTTVTYGRGKAVVTDTGMGTEFGKIADQLGTVTEEKTPLERRTEEIGKWLGVSDCAERVRSCGRRQHCQRGDSRKLGSRIHTNQGDVCRCPCGGGGSRSARCHRDRGLGQRDARDGQTKPPGQKDASRGDARMHYGDLLR